MGTNFAWNTWEYIPDRFKKILLETYGSKRTKKLSDKVLAAHEDDPRIHIGKRSAAGLYCYDCGATFCNKGTSQVHHSSVWNDKRFDDCCPICGAEVDKNDEGTKVAALRELFASHNEDTTPIEGVTTVSSFTWTAMLHKTTIKELMCQSFNDSFISDEYGTKYTPTEFLLMINNQCPIQFQLGSEFF